MERFEIIFYKDEHGNSEVKAFIEGLRPNLKRKTFQELMLLEERGNLVREPYSKCLHDGLFELRVDCGTDGVRVFYFFFEGRKILVTNGFVKKTQKTPRYQMRKAFRMKKDWESRCGHE